jgi:hypothetical protein
VRRYQLFHRTDFAVGERAEMRPAIQRFCHAGCVEVPVETDRIRIRKTLWTGEIHLLAKVDLALPISNVENLGSTVAF